MTYARSKLYRARHDRIIFGVCQGIADWRDLDVRYIRLILILLAIFTGFFPFVFAYLVAGLIIPQEPRGRRHEDIGERYRNARRTTVNDIKQDFEDLKNRVNRMEDEAIDKEKEWDDKMRGE